MKKFVFIMLILLSICIGMTVHAENECIKISMDGEVKQAKDIASGKGISFTLPDIESNKFYIKAVELAVFEKRYDESNWHIYKNDNGEESKRVMIDDVRYLNFQVDFGSGYREKCKYKIAYRYYVQSTDDLSQIVIAGSDEKEGWRLIGEYDGTKASDYGFVFYKNSAPEITIDGFTFKVHTPDGLKDKECTAAELKSTYLPLDAFQNGVFVNYTTSDYDAEDTLTVSYIIKSGETTVASGTLSDDGAIYVNLSSQNLKIKFTVTDGFGSYSETDWYDIKIDTKIPNVTSCFNDKGYWVKGKNLFSDFGIDDDPNVKMDDGYVYYEIYQDGSLKGSGKLEKEKSGVYRLDKTMTSDGIYNVELKIYDKAGNESFYSFAQKLDANAPNVTFISSADNAEATDYSVWLNESKKIIANITDSKSGYINTKVYLDGTLERTYSVGQATAEYLLRHNVTNSKTGKLKYQIIASDNAKEIDKTTNTVKIDSSGNSSAKTKEVWLDKKKPTVTSSFDETKWYETACSISASFADNPTSSTINDASGVKLKQYAVTYDNVIPDSWTSYTGAIQITKGGINYVHFRCVDNAGNETILTKTVRVNSKSQMVTDVEPTDSYRHTIYYSESKFYVVKSTAYNTKYHFGLTDGDKDDKIKVNARLVSKDDTSVCAYAEVLSMPQDSVQRDIVFNMQYLKENGEQLPDGVYDMYITITEYKSDDEYITTHKDAKACEVVIKRKAPPTPVISVSGGYVHITYPNEPLSGSLNTEAIRRHYKYQYKTVKTGDKGTNAYANYNGKFAADNMTVTALYIDIAGNTSVASKKIFKEDNGDGGGSGIDVKKNGSNTVMEESRSANVYYIGIRRNKNTGINADIFKYMK